MTTRRQILTAIGAGLLPSVLPAGMTAAFAALPTDRRLVVVVLRGALDGLAAVPPYADPAYRDVRAALAFSEPGGDNGALDLDGQFGLHPALTALHDLYAKGEMAVVHAIATPYRSRSHFDGQDVLENGVVTAHGARDGWLNRALSLFGGREKGMGLAVGQSVPLILRGGVSVGAWAPRTLPRVEDDFLTRLASLYGTDPVLGPAFAEVTRAQAMSDSVAGEMSGKRRQQRGAKALPLLMEGVGKLLANKDGPRVAVLEASGWDTHANQGLQTGALATNLRALSDGVGALRREVGPTWKETAVLVVTEFGRTVRPNGTGGTDHGTGSAAFLMGGGVAGGRVLTRWPGLAASALYEGRDLAPTTDMRALFKAVLVDHLELPAADMARHVFPDSNGVDRLRNLFRA